MTNLRVLHAPNRHVYIDHLADPTQRSIPAVRMRAKDILSPSWLQANDSQYEVLHVHFQLREIQPTALKSAVRAARASGKYLAFTVHDIEDPQSHDTQPHETNTTFLINEADVLFTLTNDAATRITTRWNRRPLVVPHPHVLPLRLIGSREDGSGSPVVAIHLKSGRPGVRATEIIEKLLQFQKDLEFTLRIDVNDDGVGALSRRETKLPHLLDLASMMPRVTVSRHPRFTDEEFLRYLNIIDVAVLPYRTGTHSGWAEACLDAGVRVLAPRHTSIWDQHSAVQSFEWESETSLRTEVETALSIERRQFWTADARTRQREQIATAHEMAYTSAIK